jgi:uncharacterized protein YegL
MYIRTGNSRLGIIHCFVIFSQLMAGIVYVHGTTSLGSALTSLNAVVQDTMEQAIHRGIINSKIPTLIF